MSLSIPFFLARQTRASGVAVPAYPQDRLPLPWRQETRGARPLSGFQGLAARLMHGAMALSDEQLERYARHIALREVGGAGQAKLLAARVLVIGAGGLGSPLILYLAAAGIGTIGVADFDTVSLSNLQRQIAHRTADIGRAKTESAAASARAINPGIQVVLHNERLIPENAAGIIERYDVIADGSDNFSTRFLINDACFFAGKTLVSAAVTEFDG